MKRWRARCVLALGAAMLAIAAAGQAVAATAGAAASTPEADGAAERRVLVMLRLPPPHFRPDADYAGGYAGDAGKHARRRVAAALARAHGLTLVAEWPMPVIGVDCFVMATPPEASPARVAAMLSHDPRIEWAQALGTFHGLGEHDPLYPLQPSATYWQLADIHKLATGRRVTVAVVDSGIDDRHPDLAGQLAVSENFVDGDAAAETHGTAVAGIIAARARNGLGMEGIAPDARLMGLRACWQEAGAGTRCNSFTLAKALHFAILHEARVINLSLSGPPDLLLQRLLDAALARGIKVVAAVDPDHAAGGFPASHPGVFAVGSDAPDTAASRAGVAVLTSFGRDVPATVPAAGWTLVSGPSFAAAHVSGLLALLTELQPALSAHEARRLIAVHRAGAVNGAAPAGSVDACATVARVARTCPCACGDGARTVRYP